MGSMLSCISDPDQDRRPPPPQRRRFGAPPLQPFGSSGRFENPMPRRRFGAPPPQPFGSSGRFGNPPASGRRDDAMTQEQALVTAAALLLQQNGVAIPFDRSASLRHSQSPAQKKQQGFPRSSSSRARSLTDPVLPPQQLVNQELKVDDLETDHFVLIHGGGFGSWCWYKTIAHLEDSGFKVNAIDLSGAGIDSSDSNNIANLSQYVKPLTSFLEKLDNGEKVILVGHDFGGTCISYAMEMFPSKVAKAVFVSASMLMSGQSTLDMFSMKEDTNDLMQQAQIFSYADGNDRHPTAIGLDKALLKDLLFNQCPVKDVALASVSMRPIPFAPVVEKLLLTEKNYGSVRRFYIETTEDNAIPIKLQQSMCASSPPERVLRLKGADHSPFFSKPQALHKSLVEISKIPSAQQ